MRKFPGPAGLIIPKDAEDHTQATHRFNDIPCSQNTLAAFTEGPWERMRKDFEILNQRDVYLPDRYNVAWVKAAAKNNELPNRKAPFLAGIIVKISTKNSIVTVILKDITGLINGMIVNALYEDYREVLAAGSVIVLRQVGVLTTGNSNCYLTITANNLVRVYNRTDVVNLRHCTIEDFAYGGPAVTNRGVEAEVVKDDRSDCDTSLSVEDEEVLHTIFDGVDADLLFEDF